MKIEFSKEWCARMADLESDEPISAGLGAFDAVPDNVFESDPQTVDASNTIIAFGRFVKLMRRKRRLSLERLANDVDIEISELVEIEDDTRHKPEPRTVYQLANYFDVPKNKLMQIAGLTIPKDAQLIDEAFRFAARSDPLVELSEEESAALEAFISVLSDKNPK